MTKPKKIRYVLCPPIATMFKPQGVPAFKLQKVILFLEEYEAIRLADYEGLKHEEASRIMKVSRPTFTRILQKARKKIADSIVNGKVLIISGGTFQIAGRRFFCKRCNDFIITKIPINNCPNCKSPNLIDFSKKFNKTD